MIVAENALPPLLFKELKNEIFSNNFPWYYENITNGYDDMNSPYVYQFSHKVIENEQCYSTQYHQLFKFSILSILDRLNLRFDKIYRARTNLETVKPYSYEHTPHIDDERNHWAAILYMNDSDGDTIFYDQMFDKNKGISWSEYMSKIEKFTIQHRETPKSNKIVIFDGKHYHSSFTPVNTHRRIIVNFTFTTPEYC